MPTESYVGTNGPTIEYIEDVEDLADILDQLHSLAMDIDDDVQMDAATEILSRAIDMCYESDAYMLEPEDEEGVEDEYDEGDDE